MKKSMRLDELMGGDMQVLIIATDISVEQLKES
jgi:hypothetical protein